MTRAPGAQARFERELVLYVSRLTHSSADGWLILEWRRMASSATLTISSMHQSSMANRLTIIGGIKALEGMALAMKLYTTHSRATALDLEAGSIICTGIGGVEDLITYLKAPES